MPNQESKNIFLFYGEDDFSLRRKIDRWKEEFAKKYSSQAITVIEAGELSEVAIIEQLKTHLSPSLFASKKLVIVKDGTPRKAEQAQLAEFLLNTIENIPKDFFVIFWQSQKPDGRLAFTKKFTSKVTVSEFKLPAGGALNQWIKAMAKVLDASISDQATEKLAIFLGRDLYEEKKVGGRVVSRIEAYDLWQVYSELSKLASSSAQIDVEQVQALVKPKIADSVFKLTDEVIAKNQKGAFGAFENFLAGQTVEEKTSIIKIIGLLSEQVRSMLVVSQLLSEGMTADQITEKLNWSPGRVFITSKNLKNVPSTKLKQLLAQLLKIDYRVKTSDSNNKLDIDLFLVQATHD